MKVVNAEDIRSELTSIYAALDYERRCDRMTAIYAQVQEHTAEISEAIRRLVEAGLERRGK